MVVARSPMPGQPSGVTDDRPATRGRRFLKLAGMTASVAGNYAGTRIKSMFQSKEAAEADREQSNRDAGTRIAQTLGELKGAVMKVGQMASIASDILPKEVAEALGSLQKNAPPMSYDVIRAQIESELGAPPEALFRSFDETPFASASIGQVHRAVLDDGREVVCKVQYPGVDGAVDSDLRHLRLALSMSGLVKVSRTALNESFEELRERLHEELDYTHEACNVRLFRAFHARHPFVVIPEVVGERSSKRVLTLTYEPGDSMQKAGETYDRATLDLLGLHLFTVMTSEIFELGAIHGDPNPGNFACRPNGDVVIYDFGCVKQLKPAILSAYRDAIRFGVEEDYVMVEDALRRLGARNPAGPAVEPSFYKAWRDIFVVPIMAKELLDYEHSTMHEDVMKMIPKSMRYMSSFQPAKEMIFLDRMVAGHYGNLRSLRSHVPVQRLIGAALEAFTPEALECDRLMALTNPV